MQILNPQQTLERLDYQAIADACVDVLKAARAGQTVCPPRQFMPLAADGTLLLMPATDGEIAVTKMVTIHPRNGALGRATLQGEMVIMDAQTGERLMRVDGGAVSARRTAAVSLLAAQYLAPRTDTPMLVYGAGTQAKVHLEAFRDGLGVRRAYIVSRTRARADALAAEMNQQDMQVTVVDDPTDILDEVRLIIAATTATEPFLPEQLPSDAFVAAVGAFRPHMAEIPPALLANSQVIVDTEKGAHEEAGDLIQAAQAGLFDWASAMDLEAVVIDGQRPRPGQTLVFKSVGQSLWDLAAAQVLARK